MLAAEFRVAVSPVIASPVLRRLLPAFAVSAVGDGMSAVGVAWLAIRIAPPADRGLVVGVAVAAYTLPGAAGAVLLARPLRALAGRHLVAADAALRAVTLSMIPLLYAFGALRAGSYVALLAASSLLHAWGLSGQYTLVAEHLTGPWAELRARPGGEQVRDLDPGRFRAAALPGARVLLIDDTWTTGSSAQSAAMALRSAGADAVVTVVLGRHVGRADAELAGLEPAVMPFRQESCAVHANHAVTSGP